MTTYKKLTLEQIDKLQIGNLVNFGDGNVYAILRFYEGDKCRAFKDGKWTEYAEKMVEVIRCLDGKTKSFYTMVLHGATTDTLDPTIEKCAYCGNLRPKNEMKSMTIWVNGTTQNNRYCIDMPCGGYDQMAAEG